jgi:hypothetical protein
VHNRCFSQSLTGIIHDKVMNTFVSEVICKQRTKHGNDVTSNEI